MSCTDMADGILGTSSTIITFCERCGDRVPGVPHAWDGTAVDLTTTYVKVSPDRYDNLAAMAGCATDGAAPSLRVVHDHGDVIIPEHTAVTPVIVQAATPHYELAVGGGALAMVALVLAARRMHVRRRHRPRL
jgi:hypothetical protein